LTNEIHPSRTRKLGKKILKKTKKQKTNFFVHCLQNNVQQRGNGTVVILSKRAKGIVGEGEAGKKAKATQHVGGQSVSQKSQVTRTSKNVFEKSNS
jgi:hypothetical protein